jgi:hypothetical protein
VHRRSAESLAYRASRARAFRQLRDLSRLFRDTIDAPQGLGRGSNFRCNVRSSQESRWQPPSGMLDLSGNCKPVVLCLNWAIPRGSATAAFVESWYAPSSNHSLHVSECRVDADVVCSNHCGGILHDVSPPVECCIAPAECCIDAAVVNSPSTVSLLMGSIPNSTECLVDAAADSAGEVSQDSSPPVECCIAPVECCFDAAVVNSCIAPVECCIDAAVVNSPGTVSLLVGSMRNSTECPVDAAVVFAGEVSHDSLPPVECCIASVECCFDAAVVNSLEAFSGAADVNVSEVAPSLLSVVLMPRGLRIQCGASLMPQMKHYRIPCTSAPAPHHEMSYHPAGWTLL